MRVSLPILVGLLIVGAMLLIAEGHRPVASRPLTNSEPEGEVLPVLESRATADTQEETAEAAPDPERSSRSLVMGPDGRIPDDVLTRERTTQELIEVLLALPVVAKSTEPWFDDAVALLAHREWKVSMQASRLIADMGPPVIARIEALVRRGVQPYWLSWALAGIGDDGIEALARLFSDGFVEVKVFGDVRRHGFDLSAAVPHLHEQLQVGDDEARRRAVLGLSELGASAKPAIRDLIEYMSEVEVERPAFRPYFGDTPLFAAVQAAGLLATFGEDARSALPAIERLLEVFPKNDSDERIDVIESRWKLKGALRSIKSDSR